MTLSLALNRSHIMTELDRLLRVYNRPAHAPQDAIEFATDYAQICGELSSEQFSGAVDAYLKSAGRWFPKPGELLALGRSVARGRGDGGSAQAQYDEWERHCWQDPATGRWTPCPVCAAVMSEHVVRITQEGNQVYRLMVLHNAVLHWRTGVGFTMKAALGTGGGKYEHKVIDLRPATVAEPVPGQLRASLPPPPTDEQLERAALQADS